jgi:hypothetical protein
MENLYAVCGCVVCGAQITCFFPLRLSKFESAALTIELRGHYKDRKTHLVQQRLILGDTIAPVKNQINSHLPFYVCHLSLRELREVPALPASRFSSRDAIPRCWAQRSPGGTRCLQGLPFFVRAPHMTRGDARFCVSTSGFGSEFRFVTVSSADTAEAEAPALDPAFNWIFGRGVLFNAKTARVAQSSNPATDLK